ncbi:MAG: response regulator [Paracoccaceae bacterium]
MRKWLIAILNSDRRLHVVGEAGDALEAREIIKKTSPDVITLDIEMPRMNGLEFLNRVMRLRPMPVVMISSKTRKGSGMSSSGGSSKTPEICSMFKLQSPSTNSNMDRTSSFSTSLVRLIVQDKYGVSADKDPRSGNFSVLQTMSQGPSSWRALRIRNGSFPVSNSSASGAKDIVKPGCGRSASISMSSPPRSRSNANPMGWNSISSSASSSSSSAPR